MNVKTLKDVVEEEIRQARSNVKMTRKTILDYARDTAKTKVDAKGIYTYSLITKAVALHMAETELARLLETKDHLSRLEE
jgi:hypothetical protein